MGEIFIEPANVWLMGRCVDDSRDRSFDISVMVEVDVDAIPPRRRATAWSASKISTLTGGYTPVLSITLRAVWCVPAWLTSPHRGV